MTFRLVDLASTRQGHPFRGGLADDPDGSVGVVQMKNVSRQGAVDCTQLLRTDIEGRKSPAWLVDGDVVMVARGAAVYAGVARDVPPRTVCSPHLYVIRVADPHRLMPEFLAWQFGQAPAQKYFAQSAEGSVQLSLRRSMIDDMPIGVPPPEAQKRIVALMRSVDREREILQTLILNREAELAVVAARLLA